MTHLDNAGSVNRNYLRHLSLALIVLSLSILTACRGCDGRRDQGPPQPQDGRIVEGGENWKDNKEVVSPIILREPLYECTDVVMVSGFIPGAELLVFEGANQIASQIGQFSSGQQIQVSITFAKGQVITARQKFQGVTSGPSNAVTVRGVKDDYPSGLPQPNIHPPPLYECGIAIGATGFLPGAKVSAQSEPSTGGGGFGPATVIGSASMAAPYPGGWMHVSPAYQKDARVTLFYEICADKSPNSPPQIVQPQPALPKPTVDNEVYEGGQIVVVRNIVNGALLKVFSNGSPIGQSGTPGGSGQQIWINPAATSGATLTATQSLCDTSDPSDGVPVKPCSDLPAAVAKQPQPGDTQIEFVTYVPGSRIVVLAGTEEIGDGGPPILQLTRPIANGEELTIIQILGECQSRFVHIITVRCPFGDEKACSADWPMFRQNPTRNAQQSKASKLANPELVKVLKKSPTFNFNEPGLNAFRASPIVFNGTVYIGNANGRFYAIDALTGAKKWQFPLAGDPALLSQYQKNPSSFGIASSAVIARINKEVDAVIFAAPDQSIGAGLGSGRLFALNAQTGAVIWKSPELAVLNGLNAGNFDELHEQIGYSSPLVLNNRVYVGIANHNDSPIQNGKVKAVDLNSGNIDAAFNFSATNTRGGGVWSSVAGGTNGELYITTGNVASGNPGGEPSVNHALSLLRLDPATGAVIWKLQPVPFSMDGDPDWASGATFIPSTCGNLAASTMKDGWSYAVGSGNGTAGPPDLRWQFPPTGFPFTPGDGTSHGDIRYLVPGAAWENVFITMTGGENVKTTVSEGFSRLHGLELCAKRFDRVRWLVDIPNVDVGNDYQLGPPTVSRGIVFVGTTQGRLIAFADPAAYPPVGFRCSRLGVSNADCASFGFKLVPQPTILLNLDLGGGGIFRTEPVLAQGRVYVATDSGKLFMLEP